MQHAKRYYLSSTLLLLGRDQGLHRTDAFFLAQVSQIERWHRINQGWSCAI